MKLKAHKLLPVFVIMLATSSGAMAHTVIADQATEGMARLNGSRITHGCNTPGLDDRLGIMAQGIVFPNGFSSQAFKLVDGGEESITLGDELVDTLGNNVGVTPTLIQDRDVFLNAHILKDETGARRAFHYTAGKMPGSDVEGLIPFRHTTPRFLPESCAKRLLVRIAIANWCSKSSSTADGNRVDVWMGHMTPKFNDPIVMPFGDDGGAGVFWPTLTINRDLAANPLPDSCGEGYDIAVQPSEADIDQFLPIPGLWPANAN